MKTIINDFKIKDETQESWVKWLDNELKLPVKATNLMCELMISFRELLITYDIIDEQILKFYDWCKYNKGLFSKDEKIRVKGKLYKGVYSYTAEAYVEAFDKIKKFISDKR